MATPIYQYQTNYKTGGKTFRKIGEFTGACTNPEVIWHLTNYSHWRDDGDNGHIVSDGCTFIPNDNATGTTNHDIVFELEDGFYVSESCGFAKFARFNDALEHLFEINRE